MLSIYIMVVSVLTMFSNPFRTNIKTVNMHFSPWHWISAPYACCQMFQVHLDVYYVTHRVHKSLNSV